MEDLTRRARTVASRRRVLVATAAHALVGRGDAVTAAALPVETAVAGAGISLAAMARDPVCGALIARWRRRARSSGSPTSAGGGAAGR